MQNTVAIAPLLRLRTAVGDLVALGRSGAPSEVPAFRTWMIALLVAISYYAGSQIGFFLTPPASPISAFWPPNAILLAAFLLTPLRIWWVLVLAVLPAHFLIQLKTGIPLLTATGWFVGNIGEASLGAVCILLFKKEKTLFESVRGVVTFWVFGVLLAPLLTSFLDAGSTVLTGEGRGYWTLWMNRLTTNIIANLTVVPAILTLMTSGIQWFRRASRAQYFEAAVLTGGTAVSSFLIFAKGNLFDHGPAFICAPLPLLIWAAVRFGPTGLNVTMLEVTLIAVWSALQGRGIFEYSSMPERIISVHILLGLFILPLMLMAAAVAEQRRKEETLDNTRSLLIQVQEQEYHRIARELHTDIAGRITLAGLGVDELRAASNTHVPLNKLHDQISDALDAILRLSHNIYPFGVEYLGLARALTKLCRDTGAENGIAISSSVGDVPLDLSLNVSLRIFRVAQLALQDLSERKAKTAAVRLTLGEGRVLLRIADDGFCMDPHSGETGGAAYIREETLSLGGTFKAMPAPHKGMVIEASVPFVKVPHEFQDPRE